MATPTEQTKVTYTTPGAEPEAIPKRKINKRFLVVLTLLVVVGGGFGLTKYIHGQHHEETDDAQIDANVNPIIPRVPGYVNVVKVKDNDMVKKGDTLVILDDRDLAIKVDQAEAALAAAESGLNVATATTTASQATISTTEANVATANAQIEAARVGVVRATQDYNRYANLVKDHTITQQQFEVATAAKESAERQLQVLVEQRNAAARQTNAASSQSAATGQQVSVANATIKQRQADLANAKLNLSYAVILAPADGRISKVPLQPGQYVQAGQTLFTTVAENQIWVVANFKETQLDRMKVGQKVTISVDALNGQEFEGSVGSFSPTTGSRLSMLPTDNASGNFVKVVQRIPVRIEFPNMNDANLKVLRPGMNVDVDVHLD